MRTKLGKSQISHPDRAGRRSAKAHTRHPKHFKYVMNQLVGDTFLPSQLWLRLLLLLLFKTTGNMPSLTQRLAAATPRVPLAPRQKKQVTAQI